MKKIFLIACFCFLTFFLLAQNNTYKEQVLSISTLNQEDWHDLFLTIKKGDLDTLLNSLSSEEWISIHSQLVFKYSYKNTGKWDSLLWAYKGKKSLFNKITNQGINIPFFEFEDIQGNNISYQRGKIYFINFFFKECPPCSGEMPLLDELSRKYKNRVTFIAISDIDNKIKLNDFENILNRVGWSFPKENIHFIHSADNELFEGRAYTISSNRRYTRNLCISTFPTSIIVNQQGEIVYTSVGYYRPEKARYMQDFSEVIDGLLEK